MKLAGKVSKKSREHLYFIMFSGIAILGFLLFYLYPIIRTIILSFTNKEIFSVSTNYVGIENYIYALTKDPLFWQSIRQSLVFAIISGACVLITSMILAMLLNTKVKGIGVFRVIYFLPFIILTTR